MYSVHNAEKGRVHGDTKTFLPQGPKTVLRPFDGKMVYFGKDHAQAAQRFAEMLTRYENGEPVTATAKQDALTVVEAVDRHLTYAAQYYGDSSELGVLTHALRP